MAREDCGHIASREWFGGCDRRRGGSQAGAESTENDSQQCKKDSSGLRGLLMMGMLRTTWMMRSYFGAASLAHDLRMLRSATCRGHIYLKRLNDTQGVPVRRHDAYVRRGCRGRTVCGELGVRWKLRRESLGAGALVVAAGLLNNALTISKASAAMPCSSPCLKTVQSS